MKTLFTSLFLLVSSIVFAQSVTMLPDAFVLPKASVYPVCTAADKGKVYYDETLNKVHYCNGLGWQTMGSQWGGITDISYNGKVGIYNALPEYELDVNGNSRIKGALYAGNVGIGNTNPFYKLHITNGGIGIENTSDSKIWKMEYNANFDILTFSEDAYARVVFANGGNVGIGEFNPSAKLDVAGTGKFDGNITVNSGKGIVQNGNGSAQLKFVNATLSVSSFLVSAGGCVTATASLGSGTYTVPPAVSLGNLLSSPTPTESIGTLNISVSNVTTTVATVRFCNTTATNNTITGLGICCVLVIRT